MTDLIPFSFDSKEIRVIEDERGELLLVAKDVAVALGKPVDFFAKPHLNCIEALFCYRFLDDSSLDAAFSWTVEISKVGYNGDDPSLFAAAYGAASMYLAWASNTSEATVMGEFNRNVGKYIHGATIVDGPKSRLHQPDAWVRLESGEICPVEGKYTKADKKALDQLLRYMRVFSRNAGILVAQSLTVALPDGVIFVEVKL